MHEVRPDPLRDAVERVLELDIADPGRRSQVASMVAAIARLHWTSELRAIFDPYIGNWVEEGAAATDPEAAMRAALLCAAGLADNPAGTAATA